MPVEPYLCIFSLFFCTFSFLFSICEGKIFLKTGQSAKHLFSGQKTQHVIYRFFISVAERDGVDFKAVGDFEDNISASSGIQFTEFWSAKLLP